MCRRRGLVADAAGCAVQVYKALKNGVQPVAVKVIPFDASDQQRADFEKEVGCHMSDERALRDAILDHLLPHIACCLRHVRRSQICKPSANVIDRALPRWRSWSPAATATSSSSWAPAATARRSCSSPSASCHIQLHTQSTAWWSGAHMSCMSFELDQLQESASHTSAGVFHEVIFRGPCQALTAASAFRQIHGCRRPAESAAQGQGRPAPVVQGVRIFQRCSTASLIIRAQLHWGGLAPWRAGTRTRTRTVGAAGVDHSCKCSALDPPVRAARRGAADHSDPQEAA